jgi:flagellar hook-basal body complex protein FliE
MAQPPIAPIKAVKIEDVNGNLGAAAAARPVETSNVFDAMLGRAIDSLNGISAVENNANALIDKYVQGKAELSDVMIATSKMTIAVQLAVSTITSAVSSFKELTQMQI